MQKICGLFLILCFLSPSAVFSKQLWSDKELNILKSLSLSGLSPLPSSASNRYADNKKAKALGEKIFFDKGFSANGQLSCATCHQPEKYFTDGLSKGVGFKETGRNTPTVVGSAWLRWFYWDGRRDSLWSQALIPFEAADEMGSNRLAIVNHLASQPQYRGDYESLFGPIPSVILDDKLPRNASPLGDKKTKDNWYRIPRKTQVLINQVYVNIGKAIEAYERTLRFKPTRFDQYVDQIVSKNDEKVAFSEEEIAGLKLFIDNGKTQCLNCHNGALFSNNGFHNVGTGTFSGGKLDFGRLLGLQAVLMDEFNCLGRFSDAKPSQCASLRFLNKRQHIPLQGAFKTPSLRNVGNTAPYFHDGRFPSLESVIQHYNLPPEDNGGHELRKLALSEQEISQLAKFLHSLSEVPSSL